MKKHEFIINADVVISANNEDEAVDLFNRLLELPNRDYRISDNLIEDKKTVILSITGKLKKKFSKYDIINSVVNYTGISRKEMELRDRNHKRVRARYIIFVELMRLLDYSLAEAAAVFNYHHSTAYWAKRLLNGEDYSFTKYYKKYLETLNK